MCVSVFQNKTTFLETNILSHALWSVSPHRASAENSDSEEILSTPLTAYANPENNPQRSFDATSIGIVFSDRFQMPDTGQFIDGEELENRFSETKSEFLRLALLKAREITPEMEKKYPADKFVQRTVKNEAFGVGESLVFSVDYGFYSAGTATMSVIDSSYINGGWCYHILTKAESNKFISSVYKVRDRVDSYIDMKGIFSRRLEKSLREGGYSFNEIIDINMDRLLAVSTKEKRAFVEVPLHVQDILSSLYYIRTFDLKVGKKETFEIYADGKVYPLQIIVHKKEKVTVEAGTFNCILIEPILKSESIFNQKGKLLVWLSDDKNKIPVKMTSKIPIGNIAANLIIYKKKADK